MEVGIEAPARFRQISNATEYHKPEGKALNLRELERDNGAGVLECRDWIRSDGGRL
jgi:hypothetical protein